MSYKSLALIERRRAALIAYFEVSDVSSADKRWLDSTFTLLTKLEQLIKLDLAQVRLEEADRCAEAAKDWIELAKKATKPVDN